MEPTMVWTELDGAGATTAHEVLEAVRAGVECHLTSAALYAEDRADAHLLVLGTPSPAAAFAVSDTVARALAERGLEPTHLATYLAAQRIGSDDPTRDESVLVVRLPVPPGREHEWNLWYADTHMTGLLETVGPTIASGTRYVPLGGTTDYLVAYDFTSTDAMRSWVDGQGITGKRSGYQERWGVRNRMRALVKVD